jgi:ABC-2 type transport system permease protein
MRLSAVKVFIAILKINLKKLLEYRALFFIELFTMFLWASAYILLIEVIFLHTPVLAGWTKSQALFILAFYYCCQTIAEIFYIDNFERFALDLRRGTLDFYLIRPAPSRLLIFLQQMQFQDISHFIITISLFIYAIKNLPSALDPGYFILGLVLVLIPATILNFSVHCIVSTLAFWLEKNETLNTIMWNFRQVAKYPRQVYTGVFKNIFSFAIPFAIMASVPAEVAMKFPNGPFPVIFIALTVFFYYFARWFWNQGLKKYTSAG